MGVRLEEIKVEAHHGDVPIADIFWLIAELENWRKNSLFWYGLLLQIERRLEIGLTKEEVATGFARDVTGVIQEFRAFADAAMKHSIEADKVRIDPSARVTIQDGKIVSVEPGTPDETQ